MHFILVENGNTIGGMGDIYPDVGFDLCDQVAAYEVCLLKTYGAVIGGRDLHHVLGYPSSDAFRQAVHRKTVPVQTFRRSGFRTRFARTHDIAKWLVSVGRELNEMDGDES